MTHDTLQYIIYSVYRRPFVLSILHIIQRRSLIDNTSVQIYTCSKSFGKKKRKKNK